MVEVIGNAVVQEGKNFFVNLSGATNGNITSSQG